MFLIYSNDKIPTLQKEYDTITVKTLVIYIYIDT